MDAARARRCFVHTAAALGWAAVAAASCSVLLAEPVPLGPEVSIDSLPGIYYHCPVLAGHDDGSFAAAWVRVHGNADSDVVVRTGNPTGALAETHAAGFQAGYIVDRFGLAATPAGYTVQWKGRTLPHYPFYAQQVDAQGANAGERVDVGHEAADVSPRPVEGFAATWVDGEYAVNLQLLDAAGENDGPLRRIANSRAAWAGAVHRGNGEILVYWLGFQSQNGNYTYLGLLARRFDVLGRPLGKLLHLLPPIPARRSVRYISVAWGEDGTIAVASVNEPGYGRVGKDRVELRTYDESGKPLQRPLLLASADYLYNDFVADGLAVDAAGNTVFLWVTFGLSSPIARAVHLPRGAATATPFDFASEASADHNKITCASVTAAGDSWVISWIGRNERQDDLFLRRFTR